MESANTLLFSAVEANDLNSVRLAIGAGADVRAGYDYALRMAAVRGYAEMISVLLAAGANIHVNDDAALRLAAANGRAKAIRTLLAAGANVHAAADESLRNAAHGGHVDVVRCFIDHGADVHAENDDALRVAALNGRPGIMRLLLAAGADPQAAWVHSLAYQQQRMVAAFDACAAAMSPSQRAALAAESRMFVNMHALLHAEGYHRGVQR